MNSQPRREVFGGRPLGWHRLEGLWRRRWVCFAGLALVGAALVIGCGRSDDGGTALAVGSSASPPANVQRPTSNVQRPTDDGTVRPFSDEPSPASGRPVTEVAFADAVEGSSGVKSTTFDDIKFEMKKEDTFKQRMLTEKVKELFDKDIRIRGYILPTFKQSGLTQFVLVRDNMECCFGPGAALFDCIVVEMVEGHTAEFSVRPVTVEGKFSFQKLELDGKLLAIYHLDGVSVK